MKRLFFLMLAAAGLMFGQWASPPTSGYSTLNTFLSALGAARTGAGAPGGTCTAGKDLYINTSASGTFYYCSATDTWIQLAPIASPTFTGTPAGPTPAVADNSTKLATTAYSDRAALRRTYNFQGVTQAGVNAWNVNYQTLVNGAYTSTDATHLRSGLVVTANTALLGNDPTNALGPWTITPVVTTNPSVHFVIEVRSTDTTNPGSMALSYACVAAGSSVDSPSPTALSAVTLATIATTKSVYASTQSVTCSGTPDAPSDLYVWWTPTAPSGGTLTNLRWALVY